MINIEVRNINEQRIGIVTNNTGGEMTRNFNILMERTTIDTIIRPLMFHGTWRDDAKQY